ncbi:hypothetical protein MKQ70_32615 [Chitinophaga sedimenti]|uniref:RNA polymerase sigma factor n=1 Tax=Chitinophaga sedimenti TaxID=2033606 RepID=UPI0020068CC3|nr:sigma factor [Chitinophaga sedimenti]MCK7559460.1 hypothetical protein [Chitinophaga sedimenti]
MVRKDKTQPFETLTPEKDRELKAIVKQYREVITIHLCRAMRDWELAQELSADVFIDVIVKLGTFESPAQTRNWLFLAARNKAVSEFRKWSVERRNKKRVPACQQLERVC